MDASGFIHWVVGRVQSRELSSNPAVDGLLKAFSAQAFRIETKTLLEQLIARHISLVFVFDHSCKVAEDELKTATKQSRYQQRLQVQALHFSYFAHFPFSFACIILSRLYLYSCAHVVQTNVEWVNKLLDNNGKAEKIPKLLPPATSSVLREVCTELGIRYEMAQGEADWHLACMVNDLRQSSIVFCGPFCHFMHSLR